MSLILEALRKSEAERQLGRAPGLMTPMPMAAGSRRRPPLTLVIVALAAAAAAGVTMWWAMRPDATDQSRITADVSTPERAATRDVIAAPSTAPATASPQPQPAATATATATGSEHSAAVEPAAPARLPPIATASPPLPHAPEFESVERESTAQFPVDVDHAILRAAPSPSPPDTASIAPAVPQDHAISAVIPAAPRSGDAVDTDPPGLAQLEAAVRDALPPLKLSMHVYTDIPADRFVLIDGRRYGEGEKLAASLQLVEVRRDGAVLDFNGTRFMLKRP